MNLAVIVAMAENRVIGKNNRLPWHLSEDLQRFKRITMGHPILMGRKTFESIGKPLPGRLNIVVSRNAGFRPDGVTVAASMNEALAIAAKQSTSGECFAIGGSSIFEAALPLATTLYLTLIHQPFEGDVYFPAFDLKNEFSILEESRHRSASSPPFEYSFITARRK